MPLAVNDILEVKLLSTLYSQRIMTVLHYVVGSAPGAAPLVAQLQDIADTITAFTDLGNLLINFSNAQVPALQYDTVSAQRIYPARSVYTTSLTAQAGTYATGGITANIAATIQKRTDTPYRYGVGRVAVAGIPTAVCVNGELTALYRTTFLDGIGSAITTIFNGALYAGAYVPCLFNPTIPDPQKYSILTGWVINTGVRTMHRRTVRLGI